MQVLPCSRLLRWTIQVFCTYMYELFFCNFFTLFVPSAAKVGTLRNDGDGNGHGREAIDLVSKTTTLHVHHAFLYISLPSLHDYDVK